MNPWTRLALSAAALLLGALFPRLVSSAFLETIYFPAIFGPIASALGSLGHLVPFSLAQIFVLFVVLGLAVLIWKQVGRIREGGRRAVVIAASQWLTVAAVVVWTFHIFWGLNYSRDPFAERTGLPEVEVTAERLSRLTRVLAAETNHSYEQAVAFGELDEAETEAERGSTILVSRETYLNALAQGYRSVLPRSRDRSFSTPKFPYVASWFLSLTGTSGIYFPFTGEASVNRGMPDVSFPFVAAHEMAHQRGVAREDEANALGYLACRSSGLWVTRYSGALAAYRRAWSALYRSEPDSARALAPSQILDEGPQADRLAIRRFWDKHQGVTQDVAQKTYDTYLKANAQTDGVLSYGRMIDILISLEEMGMIAP